MEQKAVPLFSVILRKDYPYWWNHVFWRGKKKDIFRDELPVSQKGVMAVIAAGKSR